MHRQALAQTYAHRDTYAHRASMGKQKAEIVTCAELEVCRLDPGIHSTSYAGGPHRVLKTSKQTTRVGDKKVGIVL